MCPVENAPSLAGSASRAGRQVSDAMLVLLSLKLGKTNVGNNGSHFESRDHNARPVDPGYGLGSEFHWLFAQWHRGDGFHARVPEEHNAEST
jgi:hypothetical protein